jgi:hypothetical protein
MHSSVHPARPPQHSQARSLFLFPFSQLRWENFKSIYHGVFRPAWLCGSRAAETPPKVNYRVYKCLRGLFKQAAIAFHSM